MMRAPDPRRAVAQYRRLAKGYDASAQRTMALRRRVIGMLELAAGETVLDVACGTGLSLPLLAAAVGPAGRVIGVEVSPDMLALARECVARAGWTNVTLIEASMEEVVLDAQFDAVLFNYTHDLLQSPRALDCIFGYARPGARIGIAGVKHPPPWLYPLRLYRLLKARACVTTFRDLARPWSLVERVVPDLCVSPVMLGINYCARGSVRG